MTATVVYEAAVKRAKVASRRKYLDREPEAVQNRAMASHRQQHAYSAEASINSPASSSSLFLQTQKLWLSRVSIKAA